MSKPIPQELDDIFNIIPRDGSNIKTEDESQETAYASAITGNSSVSFEEKASVVAKKLASVSGPQTEVEYVAQPPKNEQPKVEQPKIEPPKAESPKIEVSEPVKSTISTSKEGSSHDPKPQSSHERILAEALSGKSDLGNSHREVEAKPTVHSVDADDDEDDKDEPEVRPEHERDSGSIEPTTTQVTVVTESEDGWLFESTAPKYNQFYAEKVWMIPRLLRGGKIPFEQYRKELSEAYVDTKVEMYDHERISEKMTEIRQWQTRVLNIRGHVLAQYHSWKRAVELFHGVLARAEYAKPAICQQGVVYNHMRDMEMYLADLEYLYDFTKEIMANLASHFESLSRQVTLSMPLKSVERTDIPQSIPLPPPVNLPTTPKPVQKKSDLTGFDRLENGVNQEDFTTQKSKNISTSSAPSNAQKKPLDWDDIG